MTLRLSADLALRAALLAAALAILLAAWPLFAAAWAGREASPLWIAMERGDRSHGSPDLPQEARAGAEAALRRALARGTLDPRAHDQLALLVLQRLAGAPPSDALTSETRAAIGHLEHSLRLAPLRVNTWTRLAVARFMADGSSPDMIAALKMSYLLGELEPASILARIDLTFAAFDALEEDLQRKGLDQIRHQWRYGRGFQKELFAWMAEQPPQRQIMVLALIAAADEAGAKDLHARWTEAKERHERWLQHQERIRARDAAPR